MDLATVQSDEDRAKLKEAANDVNFQSFAWIGFYNGVLTWRWSYQNTVISYTKWESWQPDSGRTDEACAFVDRNQRWGDATCLLEKYFFCQTDEKGSAKFKYIKMSMKWREAQLYCRTLYTDLASVTDDTENTALTNIISANNGLDAWIGLSKNLWLWSDQTNVSWSSLTWESGQPNNVNGNEECACAGTEGQMADDACSTLRAFYCKTPEVKKQLVRVAVKSSGYLDESAVMKAIEKKMNQILSDQGMNNIIWRVQPDGKIFHQTNNTEKTSTACEEH
ncbi:macrophage mannose receptor 1-like isoform X3 [Onychostoma macrolepis]|nr:macrophage mannose receptor 1-like isoform X3 [Onychostoma macrolepis]